MADWIKDPKRSAWSIEIVPGVWDIAIASHAFGGWWISRSPHDGSYSINLDCEDDLDAAKSAALRHVAEQAQDRIKGDKAIRDAVLAVSGTLCGRL